MQTGLPCPTRGLARCLIRIGQGDGFVREGRRRVVCRSRVDTRDRGRSPIQSATISDRPLTRYKCARVLVVESQSEPADSKIIHAVSCNRIGKRGRYGYIGEVPDGNPVLIGMCFLRLSFTRLAYAPRSRRRTRLDLGFHVEIASPWHCSGYRHSHLGMSVAHRVAVRLASPVNALNGTPQIDTQRGLLTQSATSGYILTQSTLATAGDRRTGILLLSLGTVCQVGHCTSRSALVLSPPGFRVLGVAYALATWLRV
ncbi:hypothetical protein R1flu_026398 [Riccia fluitans]|uniref:Uncharacterized protein n=1 Tax=Riccia fluitans TaxID=41844 RepID=A0ABD1XGD2_9MARC